MLRTRGTSFSCSGVVVRDSHGQVLEACTRLHQHVFSAFAIEALAFITAVDFARIWVSLGLFFKGICCLSFVNSKIQMRIDRRSGLLSRKVNKDFLIVSLWLKSDTVIGSKIS
ncbi:hypothetical protein J1N35_014471 [Gossypium stocksii]|uniref:RNase H type-1 domain-containing protein n=1 Tax=Gossypium stocksii TaxID=47602 RepID=A0A9D4A8Y9_9ROSI|nr:hypothetical protein J1N35_014471 [Gossypium stocksii]